MQELVKRYRKAVALPIRRSRISWDRGDCWSEVDPIEQEILRLYDEAKFT